MTHSDFHVDVDQLSDYFDDRLPAEARAAVASHLATCVACAGQLARLRSIIQAVSDLPGEIEPPPAMWAAVRDRLVQPSRRPIPQRWILAAAAVVLVAVTSLVTAVLVRRPAIIVVRQAAPAAISASTTLPPPARSVDADYAVAIRELSDALAQHRAELDPATAAKVEQSLRVIDLAIGEARHALAADPANATLLDILAANYERKVELLRRANELPPST